MDDKVTGLIQRFLRPAAAMPDIAGIGLPPFLYSLIAVASGLLASLKLTGLGLSDAERKRLGQKDPATQRQRARGFLRLCKNRPQTAARAGIDAGIYQGIADRDRLMDLLAATLGQIVAVLGDGTALLSATLSEKIGQVLNEAQQALGSGDTPPELLRKVRVAFNAVDYQAAQQRAREQAQKARSDRKQRPLSDQVSAAQESLSEQAEVGRMVQAALQGRDLSPGGIPAVGETAPLAGRRAPRIANKGAQKLPASKPRGGTKRMPKGHR